MNALDTKVEYLHGILEGLGKVVVAFSGGVDSTYLLAECIKVMGKDRVLAVIADSYTYPKKERANALEIASKMGARLQVISTDEMEDQRFRNNPPERCYYCKSHLFQSLQSIAKSEGFDYVIYGANLDDLGDYRPGMRAARDYYIRAPLMEAGITKQEVRTLSRQMQLPTWNRPSMACLASRFPYYFTITKESLASVEKAEDFLQREMGFKQIRVRHHDAIARIEIDTSDLFSLLSEENRKRIVNHLKALGYTYVTVDLEGFRSGSMNETLDLPAGKKRF